MNVNDIIKNMEIVLICLAVAVLITVMAIAEKNAQKTKPRDKSNPDAGGAGDSGHGYPDSNSDGGVVNSFFREADSHLSLLSL